MNAHCSSTLLLHVSTHSALCPLSAVCACGVVYEQLTLLSRLSAVCPPSVCPVLVGASRKGFIGRVLSASLPSVQPSDRLQASVACAVLAAQQGALMLRVHDVKETVAALRLVDAVQQARDSHTC